jgi:hypothetical protein
MKMQTKQCSKCKEIKSIEDFDKTIKGGDKLHCWCKKCLSEYKKEYCKKNAARLKEHKSQYYKNNSDYFKKYRQEYYKNNAEKLRERTTIWRQNNPEKSKESSKIWRENNQEQAATNIKIWRENNPQRIKAHRKKRKALQKGATVETIDLIQVYESLNWVCGICGKKINKKLNYPHPKSASLDHIIPLTKGGNHILNNVQPAHLICNKSKGNRISNIQLII